MSRLLKYYTCALHIIDEKSSFEEDFEKKKGKKRKRIEPWVPLSEDEFREQKKLALSTFKQNKQIRIKWNTDARGEVHYFPLFSAVFYP